MIRAAFYAPMKPPGHPVPSGDREMARALIAALEAAAVPVDVASTFTSRDGAGDIRIQQDLLQAADAEIARLLAQGRSANWQVWVTYHNYYKAPDLIGPAVSRALGLPYVLIEATRARKRLTGPWAEFAKASEAATDAAEAVLYLTERDAEALRANGDPAQRLVHLRPFLAQPDLPPETERSASMLSVGMMRAGDKLASFALIADALRLLDAPDWTLDIAGDGPARAEVEAQMAPFGPRVRLLGALDRDALQRVYQRARILFWPGVNEAFGLSYLEAQATGLAVVAQDRPGVREVLAPGAAYPDPAGGPKALAARLDLLLLNPKLSLHLGKSARRHVADHHLMGSASRVLRSVIEGLVS